jgi:hypothetical protein
MDSYSSDIPAPPPASTPAPSSSSNTAPSSASPANQNLLAFIDEAPPAIVSTATIGSQTSAATTTSSTNTTTVQSRLPMRHEIVQLLAEAAERHGGTPATSVEIPTTIQSGSVISHDLVISM